MQFIFIPAARCVYAALGGMKFYCFDGDVTLDLISISGSD